MVASDAVVIGSERLCHSNPQKDVYCGEKLLHFRKATPLENKNGISCSINFKIFGILDSCLTAEKTSPGNRSRPLASLS